MLHHVRVQMLRNAYLFEELGIPFKYSVEDIINVGTTDFEKIHYKLIYLNLIHKHDEVISFADKHFLEYSTEEQLKLIHEVMEAALQIDNAKWIEKGAKFVEDNEKDGNMLFDAKWLQWKYYQKAGEVKSANDIKCELLKILDSLNIDIYTREKLKESVEKESIENINIY